MHCSHLLHAPNLKAQHAGLRRWPWLRARSKKAGACVHAHVQLRVARTLAAMSKPL